MRPVASDGADDGILLSANAVDDTLSVAFRLGSFVLALACGVLLFTRLLPGSGAGQVADTFDDVALGGMELT